MPDIIKETKKHFFDRFEKEKANAYAFLPRHVENVEKWAKNLLRRYPKADKKVVLTSVWLHDIGQTLGKKDEDHAIKSELEARAFLGKLNYPKEKINEIAHCVRAHRCKDMADSASHFTDINYIVHLTSQESDYDRHYVEDKIERDYRDIGIFPELKKELTPIYKAWKKLIKVFPHNI